ncbi:MAG: hypothetical protein ACKPJO_08340 [Dolichospermum sp.]
MTLNPQDVMSILPTVMHQSIPIEDLELAAVDLGINPVENFMQSMEDELRVAGTSEEAIAKMRQEFDPRTSGCYRDYLRRELMWWSQGIREAGSAIDTRVVALVTVYGMCAVQESLNRVARGD